MLDRTALARLREAIRLRRSRGQVLVAVLCALLGFALVTQVHANTTDSFLRTARTADLVRLLDDLGQRQQRLDTERAQLLDTRDRLASGSNAGAAALREAQARARALGVLAGTVTDTGPGVSVQVADPQQRVTAAVLLDTVEELRDAGAEAIQIGAVRVVALTAFVDVPGTHDIQVDGSVLARPYELRAVGDANTMAAALAIPGGVVDTVSQAGGVATVTRRSAVGIDALRAAPTPRYARPAPTP